MLNRASIALLVGLMMMLMGIPAGASTQDELAEFQLAMNAYDTGEYDTAEKRFTGLLEMDPPLKNKALIFEIHKYLGATLMFLGRLEEAEDQFEELLRQDPEYELDPVLFPTEVLDTFIKVKIRIADELAAIQAAKALASAEAKAAQEAKKKALIAKLQKASKPVYMQKVVKERYLMLAFLPFGIGQFQNGQNLKGYMFLAGEAALFTTNVTLYLLTEYFKTRASNTLSTKYVNTAQNYWTATNVVAGVLVAAIVAGIIDALVMYVKLGKVSTSYEAIDESQVPPEMKTSPPELPLEDLDMLLGFTFTWRM